MNNGLLSPATEKRMRPAWSVLRVPVPGAPARRIRIPLPNLAVLRWRLRRKRSPLFIVLVALAVLLSLFILSRARRARPWSNPAHDDPRSSLIFHRKELQSIWSWEISSGHYPSFHPGTVFFFLFIHILILSQVPEKIALKELLTNPAIPFRTKTRSRSLTDPSIYVGTRGTGPKRAYLDIQSRPPNIAYPPRPVPGSIADMDIIMKHCDFSQNKVSPFQPPLLSCHSPSLSMCVTA